MLFLSVSGQLINGSIIVTELNYHSDTTTDSGDWIELYNIASTPADISQWRITDELNATPFLFPAGTVIGANQYLVVTKNNSKFSQRYPNVTNKIGDFGFGLSNSHDKIMLFDAALQLQYTMTYIDSAGWPKGADGNGRTLELASISANPNLASSWFDGCMFGSPGKAYQPCNPPIVFSEINYNSDTLMNSGDWVELHNRSGSPLNISGWRMRDSQDTIAPFVFPVVTIPANGYLVVYRDQSMFEAIHPNVSNKVGPMMFGLGNGGEKIRLYNAQNELQFSVIYDDNVPWDTLADGYGYTLELLDPTGKINDGTNWRAGCFLGSPGQQFDPSCGLSIMQVANLSAILLSEDRSTINITAVENIARYQLVDVSGRIVKQGKLNNLNTKIEIGNLLSGFYILTVNDTRSVQSFKFVR